MKPSLAPLALILFCVQTGCFSTQAFKTRMIQRERFIERQKNVVTNGAKPSS